MKNAVQERAFIKQLWRILNILFLMWLTGGDNISFPMHRNGNIQYAKLPCRSSFSRNGYFFILPNMYRLIGNSLQKDLELWEEERQSCEATIRYLKKQVVFLQQEIPRLEEEVIYWKGEAQYWDRGAGWWRNAFLFWQKGMHDKNLEKRRLCQKRYTFAKECRKNTWIASGNCWHCETDACVAIKGIQKQICNIQQKIKTFKSRRQQLTQANLKKYLIKKKQWRQRFCLWSAKDQRSWCMFQQDYDGLSDYDTDSSDGNSSDSEYESCNEEFFDVDEDKTDTSSKSGKSLAVEADSSSCIEATTTTTSSSPPQETKDESKNSATKQSLEVRYPSLKHVLIQSTSKKCSAEYIPGYNVGGHMSSLISMQGVLLDLSEQIAVILKTLPLRSYEHVYDKIDIPLSKQRKDTTALTFNNVLNQHPPVTNITPYYIFSSVEGHETNLEYKTHLTQLAIIIDSHSDMNIGLVYHHRKNKMEKYEEVQLGSGIGSVKAKAELEGISAIAVLNPRKRGITGHIVSYYGWGNIKNIRSFSHMDGELHVKGNPKVYLIGGLLQLGYTIFNTNKLSIMPYVEVMTSTVGWNSYNECSSILPCKVSSNTECKVEKGFGIRSYWKATKYSQLQAWMVAILGSQKASGISCRPLIAQLGAYDAFVTGHNRHYTRVELGVSYIVNLSDRCKVSMNGLMHVGDTKRFKEQVMSLQWNYLY